MYSKFRSLNVMHSNSTILKYYDTKSLTVVSLMTT